MGPSVILQKEDVLDGVGGAAASSFLNSQIGSSSECTRRVKV